MGSIPGGYMNQCYLTQKCTQQIPQKTKIPSMKNAVNLLPCTLMASLTSYCNFLEYKINTFCMVIQISVNFAQKLTRWHTHTHCNTVKPLITDPPRERTNLSTADGSLAPDWFYYRTNTFRTSEKRTPLNSETTDTDRAPTYLGQYKITSENGQWSYTPHNADACRPLS